MDEGLIALNHPEWLQGAFETPAGIFNRVGLRKNVGKTFGMLCRPLCKVGNQSEEAYKRRMTGTGPA